MKITYHHVGDSALQISFGQEISEAINIKVYTMAQLLKDRQLKGILELVPAYTTLTIYYNPLVLSSKELLEALQSLEVQLVTNAKSNSMVLEIPVCYGGDLGPDLEFVAKTNGLSLEEAIALHTAPYYRIYMLGFLPGFTYLGGLNQRLATPRLKEPRLAIAPGSVGIAGQQTGIYPLESPGGWQLIGRTPLKLYDPLRPEPFLPQAGHYIHFKPISQEEYTAISQAVANNTYTCATYPLPGGVL